MTRPILFISWSVRHGRSRDLATALGAEAVFVGIRRRRRRWLTPVRYIGAAAVTVGLLARRRPAAILVMTPPVPLAVLALTYGRLLRVPVALDAHTGAVLAMRSGRPRRSLPLLARAATTTIVTSSQLADPLRHRRIRTIVLHNPIETADGADAAVAPDDFVVVAPLSWAADEPFDQIVHAAAACPDIRFVATGRPPGFVTARSDLPANLELVGFLSTADFAALLRGAGVVLALTTRDATMQQAGYEAMAWGRPVIASDTRVLREFFGEAALYAASGEQLAGAVRASRDDGQRLAAAMRARRTEMQSAFDEGLVELKNVLGLAG